jgi:hypothetical protein
LFSRHKGEQSTSVQQVQVELICSTGSGMRNFVKTGFGMSFSRMSIHLTGTRASTSIQQAQGCADLINKLMVEHIRSMESRWVQQVQG